MNEIDENNPDLHEDTSGYMRIHEDTSGYEGDSPPIQDETPQPPQKSPGLIPQLPEIIMILAKRPELRRELIKWVKNEFGLNIESYLEEYFDELPDKKIPRTKIEEHELPLRSIAENVLQMGEDGFSNSQIAVHLDIYPMEVSRILKSRESWVTEISNAARKKTVSNKKIPWLLRLLAWLRLI